LHKKKGRQEEKFLRNPETQEFFLTDQAIDPFDFDDGKVNLQISWVLGFMRDIF